MVHAQVGYGGRGRVVPARVVDRAVEPLHSGRASAAPVADRGDPVEVTLAVIGEPSLDLHCRTALIGTAALDVLVLSSPRAQAAEVRCHGLQ